MQFFNQAPNFDFMGRRNLALIFSALLIVISIGSLAMRGLNLGLDFTGGTLIEVGYPNSVKLSDVRAVLDKAGFDDAVVQHFGTSKDVLIRIAPRKDEDKTNQDQAKDSECDDSTKEGGNIKNKCDNVSKIGDKILALLQQASGDTIKMRRQEFVGPQIGDELRDDGGIAMLIALAFILIYVIVRFEWRFALGSVAALIHDVILTLGFFSVLQLNFDLTVLAAILAVIGYSLNDTIVVFDRIRENFRKIRKGTSLTVVNTSLNQTLSRTLMTSLTTLLVLIAMFFFGGELIHVFAIALIIGVVVGTYSSIYIASTTALALGITRTNLMPVAKEGADQESLL